MCPCPTFPRTRTSSGRFSRPRARADSLQLARSSHLTLARERWCVACVKSARPRKTCGPMGHAIRPQMRTLRHTNRASCMSSRYFRQTCADGQSKAGEPGADEGLTKSPVIVSVSNEPGQAGAENWCAPTIRLTRLWISSEPSRPRHGCTLPRKWGLSRQRIASGGSESSARVTGRPVLRGSPRMMWPVKYLTRPIANGSTP